MLRVDVAGSNSLWLAGHQKYAPTGVSPIDYKYIFYRVPVKGYMKGREMMKEKIEKEGKNR